MYTFQPLPPVTPDHAGFVLICIALVVVLIVCIMNEPEAFFVWFFMCTIVAVFSWFVSYSWTNQEVKYYPNVKVEAQLVGFEAEGYKEKSGKSYVDRHFVYVVYSVNGSNVLMNASTGVTYPKTAILYKN